MNAYISLESYCNREETNYGIGVSVSLDEEVLKKELVRKKNVLSNNNWLKVEIPDEKYFLDTNKLIKDQNETVLEGIKNEAFLSTVFIYETKKLCRKAEKESEEPLTKDDYEGILDGVIKERYESFVQNITGLDYFTYLIGKSDYHDKRFAAAILYKYGIKGCKYSDAMGDHILIFNPKDDIQILDFKSECLIDSKISM